MPDIASVIQDVEQLDENKILSYGTSTDDPLRPKIYKDIPEVSAWIPPSLNYGVMFGNNPTVDPSEVIANIAYSGDSPFTQAELINTQDDKVQALIFQIRLATFIPNNESLANRILDLFKMEKEDNPNSPGISVDSLSNFYDFLTMYLKIKKPSLTLSPDYNIYASWKSDQHLFSIHFLPNDEIRFVLFKPNSRHPGQKIRVSGTATNDTLIKAIPPDSLNNWVPYEK
jgi:hypothetical protein